MSIAKKIGFYLFILASIALAVFGYFRLQESKVPTVSVLEHIPSKASCIIETKKFRDLVSQLTRQNLIWNKLLEDESLANTSNCIHYLDSLISSSSDISDIIRDNSVYWVFVKDFNITKNLVAFKLKEKSNEALLTNYFNRVFAKEKSVNYMDAFYFNLCQQKWLIGCKDGIVYLSSNASFIQSCLDLNVKESIAHNAAYNELSKLNDKQNTHIYFNHQLNNLFSKQLFTKQSLFEIEANLNAITFTGYTLADTTSLLNSFKGQDAEVIKDLEHLPISPVTIHAITLSNPELFYSRLNQQDLNNHYETKDLAWNAINDSALYNIEKESLENIDHEITEATYFLDSVPCHMLSVQIKDAEKSTLLLNLMKDTVVTSNEFSVFKLSKKFNRLFSFTEVNGNYEYACVLENHLLFFSNKTLCDFFQTSVLNNQVLGKSNDFMKYAQNNLFLESNYLYYENTRALKHNHLKSGIQALELVKSEQAISELSITTKNHKRATLMRINASQAQPNTDIKNTSNSLWSFNADVPIKTSVFGFVNHLTQENELCFQDQNNTLYLMNSTGNLIWKKLIKEEITSEIYTVDLFKNGKLQLLFNTPNYLHLIDRNGLYVQGYPVKLPAKASSPLTLLDYEKNKDYRLFIACDNRLIYNFTLYGVRTEGFVPVKTDAIVTLPISYVKVGASDYLLTADVDGGIYAFSRKGLGRIDFENKTIQNLNHLSVLAGSNLENTKLIYLDDNNSLLNKISLRDKKEALIIGDDLSGFKTSFAFINDDSQADVLICGNGALYGYDLFTNKLMEYFNEQAVYETAEFIKTSGQGRVLAFDKIGARVDVINTKGKLTKYLLNVTQQPFVIDLYAKGKKYILTVHDSKVSCQELN